MTIVEGADVPIPSVTTGSNDSSGHSSSTGTPKCQSEYNAVRKKKRINLDTTGDKKTNSLLSYLQCQVQKNGLPNVKILCNDISKEYTKCHQSFMGTGSYQGRKDCGKEMNELWDCVRRCSTTTQQ